ncbi:MAG: PASTA domain-containing protein, partial [Oscillospiraceae bacterium]|nr:PASTA domain-containing protein [Oscillospiraceae bacterium]
AVGQKVTVGSIVVAYTEKGESTMVTVPNLVGKSPSGVETTLTSRGLNLKETGAYSGNKNVKVYKQSPNAGDKVPMGTVITVTYQDPNYAE